VTLLGSAPSLIAGGNAAIEAVTEAVTKNPLANPTPSILTLHADGVDLNVLPAPETPLVLGPRKLRYLIQSVSFSGQHPKKKDLFVFVTTEGKGNKLVQMGHVLQCKKAAKVADEFVQTFKLAMAVTQGFLTSEKSSWHEFHLQNLLFLQIRSGSSFRWRRRPRHLKILPYKFSISTGRCLLPAQPSAWASAFFFYHFFFAALKIAKLMYGSHSRYGRVYMAEHTDKSGRIPADFKQLAVKLMRPDFAGADMSDFLSEALVMREFKHPKVLSLVGLCVARKPWAIVIEFMYYKDLGVVLRQCRKSEVYIRPHEMVSFAAQVRKVLFVIGCLIVNLFSCA
jgi:hypothetical protein